MTEPIQRKQDYVNTQVPEHRSSVDAALNPEPCLRKWKKGTKVWVKNPATKTFEWLYYVSEYRYNEERRGWDYRVKDENGILYEPWVVEPDLKKG